ncbi:protein phosphatase 2C 51-like [Malania oleifera]|uniref:protein phosphatase 2C 51-like n=1 Tax=Malania oleifera TaxID=397392 RepID=UPI0025ADDC1E|nr:protein phosphatase 2C 51-like [Malania oleifera]
MKETVTTTLMDMSPAAAPADADPREVSESSAKKEKNSRRRRHRLRLRPGAKNCVGAGGEGKTLSGDVLKVTSSSVSSKSEHSPLTSMSLSSSPSSLSSSGNSSENDVVGVRMSCKPGDLGWSAHGVVSVIGRRREMEDAVTVQLGFAESGSERYDFFGVYDGHGGVKVAEACRERLHRLVAEEMAEEEEERVEWGRVMMEGFGKMDDEVNGAELGNTTGSTAVVAVVGREEVVVANCGDSRAVLFRGGVAVPLSDDHKPNRPDELKRVEEAGGRVVNWNGCRVLGVLATSRSIGDLFLKPFVSSEPEVTICERNDNDEFLVLASDGLWDVISNEAACKVVRRCLYDGSIRRRRRSIQDGSVHVNGAMEMLNDHQNRAAMAAAVLMELAIARGSRDNISVIVVELRKPSTTLFP